MKILSREPVMVPAHQLIPHPDNPRKGNQALIEESIQATGFYGGLIAQAGTGFILAGNHRYKAGLALGLTSFLVFWVQVTEREARKLLLADNRTSDLASSDPGQLLKLLDSLHAEYGADVLTGTGYSMEDMQALQVSTAWAPPEKAPPPVSPEDIQQPNATFRVGEHWCYIDRERYLAWIDDVRFEVGFSDAEICAEILRRLGLEPV